MATAETVVKKQKSVDPLDLIIIGVDTQDSDDHELFDPRSREFNAEGNAADKAFVANVDRFGVLEPVICRERDGKLEVVAGRRRTLSARLVNENRKNGDKVLVPVELTEEAVPLGVTISENEIRREDTPIAKAKKAARMMNGTEMTPLDVALAFGVSQQTVKKWLKLLTLPLPIQKKVDQKKFAVDSAYEIALLPPEEQMPRYEIALGQNLSAAALTADRKNKKAKKKATDEDAHREAPKKRLLTLLVEGCENEECELGEEAYEVLKWVLGRSAGRKIDGLAAAIKAVTTPKAKDEEEEEE